MFIHIYRIILTVFLSFLSILPAMAVQCPATVPVQGAPPPDPLPVFPSDNWWNVDISSAPIDSSSSSYIAFIGGTRRLHPDFGGEVSAGSQEIYGMPYVIVNGTQTKQSVTFDYWDESDGVDYTTGQGVPFYPIPAEAITQAHWIEGGAPGNIDQRSQSDRHLLVIDCTHNTLYELYNVFYDTNQGRWYAGSGAFFDMNTNDRRPDGWTSADAAGLAIFPGLVRYDEVMNDSVPEIGHAFRVTVRSTNGYVYPASHRAGSTSGALPMGARLRLKTNVNGSDPALRTSDTHLQKVFRAMQKHGLIVADNGSDLYITGTFDTRWNNDILNPAFALLTASDFEVVQLGWEPTTPPPSVALDALTTNVSSIMGGNTTTGTVTLTGVAPAGGAVMSLSSSNAAVSLPSTVTIPEGANSVTFTINSIAVSTTTSVTLSASYNGIIKTTILTITPPPKLSSITVSPTSVKGGVSARGTVTLTLPALTGGATVALRSSNTNLVSLPSSVTVSAGAPSASFTITTRVTQQNVSVTLYASYLGVNKNTRLTIKR